MREIEVKILEIDRKDIERRLLEFGAEKIFDGNLHAVFFSTDEGKMLRLRTDGTNAVLTYKERIAGKSAKVCEEKEIAVSDFEETKQILLSLGFSITKAVEKHRLSYTLSGSRFEFDKYRGDHERIPEFLEIEAPDEATAFALAQRLGFCKEDCKPWSLKDLLLHYNGR